MKMLYVLSPPRTPPPSPWTSMRDTSPPLSCPSSNSNSSSSINSSCSYGSSQSERGRCEETGSFSTTSREGRVGSSTRKCRRIFERENFSFFENTSEKIAPSNSIRSEKCVTSVNRNAPSGISTSGHRFSNKAKIISLNGGGRSNFNSVDSSTTGGHFPNRSQSEKSFSGHVTPASNEVQSYGIRVSQSLGRCDQGHGDAITSTNRRTFGRDPLIRTSQQHHHHSENEVSYQHAQNWSTKNVSNPSEHHHLDNVSKKEHPNGIKNGCHRRHSGGEGFKLVTSKNKTSKATRIWLNAIEKANGGMAKFDGSHLTGNANAGAFFDGSHLATIENFGGSSGGGEKENLVGVMNLKNGLALKSKVNDLQRDDDEVNVRGNEEGGGGKVTPTPRHYSKNVRCRLKRKIIQSIPFDGILSKLCLTLTRSFPQEYLPDYDGDFLVNSDLTLTRSLPPKSTYQIMMGIS
ncbi:hypothetical protein WDU94_002746 [Cyamophila willieti]